MGKEAKVTYEPTDQPIIFQATALGEAFRRQTITLPNGLVQMQGRRVEIGLAWDEAEGDLVPVPYRPKDLPPKGDFSTIKLNQAMLLREQMQRRDIVTVRKHGASRQFINVDPLRTRFQIPKPRHSFALNP